MPLEQLLSIFFVGLKVTLPFGEGQGLGLLGRSGLISPTTP